MTCIAILLFSVNLVVEKQQNLIRWIVMESVSRTAGVTGCMNTRNRVQCYFERVKWNLNGHHFA